jgi:uncharacterized protein (DUF2252 family)
MFSSTTADSSSCSVHRARPFGGGEQASAISLASAAPSKMRFLAEAGECRRVRAAPNGLNDRDQTESVIAIDRNSQFTHCRARQFQVTRDRTDALLADQMTAPDLGNHILKQHPEILQRKRRMIVWTRVETIGRCLPLESGKFCTLLYTPDR